MTARDLRRWASIVSLCVLSFVLGARNEHPVAVRVDCDLSYVLCDDEGA